ncbi:metabolite traffic protein EboE [Rubritalea spongiae]|uniref:Metabolite traffic protein EboE n=1 Tax=Rubritalea spongiae TaxID=430797 RepID=A0ABW5EBK1_9BACT
MHLSNNIHLSYCTNIHPAETWQETWDVLKKHTMQVRNNIEKVKGTKEAFALGMRLSAVAASELLENDNLDNFKAWLEEENAYVYTINGFPYGAFHGTRVKEKVYQPDWSTNERLSYTLNLFNIIAELAPAECGGSVSTLPGSFKEFEADEETIFNKLYACAEHIALLAEQYDKDLHLGLEPEPLGHFENTEETLAFFERFRQWASLRDLDSSIINKHIGLNYDTCHFALEFEDCANSLDQFAEANIRISKIHLSNALSIDATSSQAIDAISAFDEPTYLHQVIIKESDGNITRIKDLPEALEQLNTQHPTLKSPAQARIHFHIPLYDAPAPPLGSTRDHAEDALAYLKKKPETCLHLEMETYTWGVLPNELQLPIDEQLTQEYLWTLKNW